ncbi:glycoside hydrolase family 13 protein [Lichenicola sp.]|uniref:glycoside hydrolase family 13 protein n=1 Tax=Lichenicola sp. TaxID=2804529 RepID=UPI003AFF7B40
MNLPTHTTIASAAGNWWRNAVIYQIYPRSFADADGDGIGDLPGILSRMEYLAALGVDALWLSPFYRSPQTDAGYDVSDYRDVDPLFGTLDDFDRLLQAAHARDLRIIVDLVPNHTSDEHAWFRAALASPPGSVERARYMFRDGRGADGSEPPNNWQSVFGGGAWSRAEGDRQWYLHLFDRKQPDLDWNNPEVRTEFESVLRFWLDRGVDGFRVDVAHGLIKAAGLPDWAGETSMVDGAPAQDASDGVNRGPMWDQDNVHAIYRDWRRILDSYPGDRMMVAEAWVRPQSRLARYVRPDEMNQAFNFDYLLARWNAPMLRTIIDASLAAAAEVGAPATWVTSNHDTVRITSRLGLSHPGIRPKGISAADEQPDEALGLRRARALAMLTLALPGSAYIYQGEELGLPEDTTMPATFRQDPAFRRTGGREIGRDGCRVPLPWVAGAPSLGFGPGAATWLPQPEGFAGYAVDRQEGAPDSTLELYHALLRLRREHGLGRGAVRWQASPDQVLVFDNGPVRVVVNLGTDDVDLPPGTPIASSLALPGEGRLPGNGAAWLSVP